MAASEWPRGRWLVAYSDMHGHCRRLKDAKDAARKTLLRL